MKKTEIVIDGVYANAGMKETREIINNVYPRYPGQWDSDCVEYRVVSGRRSGITAIMTRAAFAAWARSRVDGDAD